MLPSCFMPQVGDVIVIGGRPAGLAVQLVIVAAAEGTKAAFAINKALLEEDGLTADG